MKRKIFAVLICFCLICGIGIPAAAASQLPMVVDNAGLLSEAERNTLEEQALSLRGTYEMDIVILTVNSLKGKSAANYADDYYDQNGYGYGDSFSGILFLLAMEEREWYFSTCGSAIYLLTDYDLDQLGDWIVPYLSDGDYYNAFVQYLDALPSYLDADGERQSSGRNEKKDDYIPNYGNNHEEIVYYGQEPRIHFGISLLIGVIAATVVILIMRSSMNTRRRQYGAGTYLKPGSYHLHTHQDLFLYSRVSKVRRQENQGGHGGGGSHAHRSSGGRSHGGRGGRF